MSSSYLSDIEIGKLKQSEDIKMSSPISQNGMRIKVTSDLKTFLLEFYSYSILFL